MYLYLPHDIDDCICAFSVDLLAHFVDQTRIDRAGKMDNLEQPSLAVGTSGEVSAEVDPVQVVVKTLKAGDATHKPKKGQTVRVHYDAYLMSSGELFVSNQSIETFFSIILTSFQ